MTAARLRVSLASGAVAVLLAGCGALAPKPVATVSQADTGVIGYYMPATLAQLASGSTFGQTLSTLQKEAFERCIGRLGFDAKAQSVAFTMLDFMPFGALNGWVQAREAGLGLVNLATVAHGGNLVPIYGFFGPLNARGLPQAELRALRFDQWRCWQQVRVVTAALDRQGFALFQKWYATETRILQSAPVQAADKTFSTCVLLQGAPRAASGSLRQFIAWMEQVVNRGTGYSRVIQGFFGGPVAFSGPVAVSGGGPRSSASGAGSSGGGAPGSSSAVAQQQADARWTAVFTRCAGPLVAMLQAQLLIKQSAFLQGHFGQVSALEQRSARIMTVLEKMAGMT